MSIKSNITIKSNIYNRKFSDIKLDVDFVKNVSGYKALTILKKNLHGTCVKAKLNEVQIEEQTQGVTCSLAKNGEITHGKVLKDNKIIWVCRCEYRECLNFNKCSSSNEHSDIIRNVDNGQIESDEYNNELKYKYLGIDFNANHELLEGPKEIIGEEDYMNEILNEGSESQIDLNEIGYKKIDNPNCLITSNIDDKILVNAGPGTGKTYTVIKRLIYILKNKLANPDYILVLCYTRAAKEVIIDRIESEIESGNLSFEAKRINICTFDSLASLYLSAEDKEFQTLSYNERIELFNNSIQKEMFDYFEYLIIDEIQDLVNERAKMVINIIKNTNCGYLLLGDKCQAIYDYYCGDNKTIDSVEFYKQLNEILPQNILKYELSKNNRQDKELADLSDEVRQVLLNFDILEQNRFVSNKIKNISIEDIVAEKFKPIENDVLKTAILCRNNGEAQYISNLLNKNKISHILLRESNYNLGLNRWLADMFWDYCERKIGKESFIQRYLIRVKDDVKEAESMFNILNNICNEQDLTNSEIDMNNLCEGLKKEINLPNEVLVNSNSNLFVSTIHKAKGREFDKVYLLENNFKIQSKTAEEARIMYVGITRPKKEIKLLKKGKNYNWYFNKSNNGRVIKTAIKPYYKNQTYCTNIEVGLNCDIDNISFISKNSNDYLNIQEYIAKKISVGDEVELVLNQTLNTYCIYHNNFKIGQLSDRIIDEFRDAINKTGDKRNIPIKLTGVYVSNVITIVNNKYDENIPLRFRESNMWLGVEIIGLGKAEYLKG